MGHGSLGRRSTVHARKFTCPGYEDDLAPATEFVHFHVCWSVEALAETEVPLTKPNDTFDQMPMVAGLYRYPCAVDLPIFLTSQFPARSKMFHN